MNPLISTLMKVKSPQKFDMPFTLRNQSIFFSFAVFDKIQNSTTIAFSLSYLPTPPLGLGYDTRSIFKRSLTGFNSEFSFSETSCRTKAEEPSLPYYFTHSWRENNWIHTFPKGMSAM